MAPFLAAIALATTVAPAFDAPRELVASLGIVDDQLAIVDRCLSRRAVRSSRDERMRYRGLRERVDRLRADARGIWGHSIEAILTFDPRRAQCGRAGLAASVRSAEAQLAVASATYRRETAAMTRGVWLGPLELCRDTVLSSGPDNNSFNDEPVIRAVLTDAARARLTALTARAVGLPLAIRVAGTVISAPVVNEPITGGAFTLSSPRIEARAAALRSMKDAC